MNTAPNKGFTLLEITVVVVIVALLVGGIFVGRDLYSAARNRGVIKELETYQRAVQLFKSKYEYYPGDLPDVQKYWPYNESGTENDEMPGGNGDGVIFFVYEGPSAWLEMQWAGFVNYSGSRQYDDDFSHHYPAIPGNNIPESNVVKKAGWTLAYSKHIKQNMLLFGKQVNPTTDMVSGYNFNWLANRGALSAKDMFYIDSKIDDGDPQLGNIRVNKGAGLPYYSATSLCIELNSASPSGYAYRKTLTEDSLTGGCNFYSALDF